MIRQVFHGVVWALVLAGVPASASADAVIEQSTRSDGFAGMGGFESTSVTTTSTTAQRDESRIKFTGAFLGAMQRMAGGGGDTVRITRLDRDVVWALDPEKKTYTEAPLTVRGEREHQAPPAQRPKEKREASDVVVTRNEFKAEKTGASRTINGFPCEEYLVTWLVETRNQKTGETGKSLMTSRLWTTPETAEIRAAQAEELAYHRTYLTKLGLGMSPDEARKFGIATMASITGLSEPEQERALARLGAELAKIQGYAIVTRVEWNLEGSGGTAEARESPQGGSAPQGLGELMKLFGGGQKGGRGDAPRTGEEKSASLFSLYTEVKSVRVVSPDPRRYEIPAGFTRK